MSSLPRQLTVVPPYLNAAQILLIAASLFFLCVELYSPSLHGSLFFDDFALPFAQPDAATQPLSYWVSGVRPVLMVSYMVNSWVSGRDTFSYHLVNLVIHTANTCLVFAITFRLLLLAGCAFRNRVVLALFCSAVFLVHPLQTESVSYIAGRSESLASLFALAAWSLFLYRRKTEIGWLTAGAVLLLSALATASKENMVAILALLLLTDFFWNRPFSLRGIRGNWRLYVPMAAGSVVALAWVARILAQSSSAGPAVEAFSPFTYFLTESRVLWKYVLLFVFPVKQSIDHDISISHTILEHGALIALLLWGAALGLAIAARRRYPLACFGVFVFLILLAPTSSVVPIADAMVERRIYLPMVGLLFIVCDGWKRARISPALVSALGSVVLVLAFATYHRNEIWSKPFPLWLEALEQFPLKGRIYMQAANAANREGRCGQVQPYFHRAEPWLGSDRLFLQGQAVILECAGDRGAALHSLQTAVAIRPDPSLFELEGLLFGEMGRMAEAKDAFDRAIQVGPKLDSPYESRGYWYEVSHRPAEAEQDYQMAARLNPFNYSVRSRLRHLRATPAESSK